MQQGKVFVIVNIVLGALLVFLAQVALPVCSSMGAGSMRCKTSSTVDAFLGLSLLVFAVIAAGLPRRNVHAILSALSFVVGCFVSLVPSVIIGTCPHAEMACRAITAPALAVYGVVIALFSVLNFLYLTLKRRHE